MSSEIKVCDGKYTFIKNDDDYKVQCLRYGEPWMVFEKGHNAISSLLWEYEELQDENKRLRDELDKYKVVEQILNKAIPEFLAENFSVKA